MAKETTLVRAVNGPRQMTRLAVVDDNTGAMGLDIDIGIAVPPGPHTYVLALAVEGAGPCEIDSFGGIAIRSSTPADGLLCSNLATSSRGPDWHMQIAWFRLFTGSGVQRLVFSGPEPVHTVATVWRVTGYAPWLGNCWATTQWRRDIAVEAIQNTVALTIGYSEDAGRGSVLAGMPRNDLDPHYMSGNGFMFAAVEESPAAERKRVRLDNGPAEKVLTHFSTVIMPVDDGLPVEVPVP